MTGCFSWRYVYETKLVRVFLSSRCRVWSERVMITLMSHVAKHGYSISFNLYN